MRTLPVLFGALLVSTAVHYTDNWLSIGDYGSRSGLLPENPWLVPVAWVLFAVVGTAGYREYRGRGATTRAHLLLSVFSLSGISSLLHLLSGGHDFTLWQWASVLSDGTLGLAMLGFALWSAARARPAAAVPG